MAESRGWAPMPMALATPEETDHWYQATPQENVTVEALSGFGYLPVVVADVSIPLPTVRRLARVADFQASLEYPWRERKPTVAMIARIVMTTMSSTKVKPAYRRDWGFLGAAIIGAVKNLGDSTTPGPGCKSILRFSR